MCHRSLTLTIAVRITEAHNITSEHFSDLTVHLQFSDPEQSNVNC